MPAPPSEPSSAGERRRRSGLTFIAVWLIGCIGAGILLALPTGFIGPMIVFGGALFVGVITFHYVVWGWWLERILRDESAEESGDD